jgi:hypothetical protein
MKCPKCGFNSFEYYDICKKCSSDLVGYKQTHSITTLVLPLEAKEKLAAEFRAAERSADPVNDSVETHDDIFSFDLPDDSSAQSSKNNDDPFNFDVPSLPPVQTISTVPDEDLFADLLETTPQHRNVSPPSVPPSALSPSAPTADSTSGLGDFDLESFSWDDTPTSVATPDSNTDPDDFDALFGDTEESTVK